MCGLCGIMGAEGHWTDTPYETGLPPRQLRYRRITAANAMLAPVGLQLSDFNGAQHVLRDRTGRTVLFTAFAELWRAVDALVPTPPDPLDPVYLRSVARRESDAGG